MDENKNTEIKGKILEIMSLALEINPPEIRSIGMKKTAVFVEYSPHCSLIRVNIHYGGWTPMSDSDKSFEVNGYDDSASIQLDEVIEYLTAIKEAESDV